jgi:N utilization substance protein B
MKSHSIKGRRTRARIATVEILYRIDLVAEEPAEAVDSVIQRRRLTGGAASYVRTLVETTLQEQKRIDEALQNSLTDWKLQRLSYVDRAILRLAACEILFLPDIPPKVSIDEAVELARFYGTEGSARFVNGVIDSLYKREVKASDTG